MSTSTQDRLAIITSLGMLIFMGLAGRGDTEGAHELLVGTLRLLTIGCMFALQALISIPYNGTHQANA